MDINDWFQDPVLCDGIQEAMELIYKSGSNYEEGQEKKESLIQEEKDMNSRINKLEESSRCYKICLQLLRKKIQHMHQMQMNTTQQCSKCEQDLHSRRQESKDDQLIKPQDSKIQQEIKIGNAHQQVHNFNQAKENKDNSTIKNQSDFYSGQQNKNKQSCNLRNSSQQTIISSKQMQMCFQSHHLCSCQIQKLHHICSPCPYQHCQISKCPHMSDLSKCQLFKHHHAYFTSSQPLCSCNIHKTHQCNISSQMIHASHENQSQNSQQQKVEKDLHQQNQQMSKEQNMRYKQSLSNLLPQKVKQQNKKAKVNTFKGKLPRQKMNKRRLHDQESQSDKMKSKESLEYLLPKDQKVKGKKKNIKKDK